MIVQSAAEGNPNFVMMQTDHALACGQLAEAFGNDVFAELNPKEALIYVVAHHDEGWTKTDNKFLQNPDTGLPYSLVQTPLTELVKTSEGSPEFNEEYHGYSGLLSSMHTYGLYHGRYGLSNFLFIEKMTPELKPAVENMLQGELDRQARLKAKLSSDARSAAWVEEETLFHNYKLLQFFDTLGLYMQMNAPGTLGETEFTNVPMAVGNDVTIKAHQVDELVIALDPFPFVSEIKMVTKGRYLTPQPMGTDLSTIFDETKLEEQIYTVVAD